MGKGQMTKPVQYPKIEVPAVENRQVSVRKTELRKTRNTTENKIFECVFRCKLQIAQAAKASMFAQRMYQAQSSKTFRKSASKV